jgi:fluoride exporter
MFWVFVFGGGLVGAPCRFLVDRWVTRRSATSVPLGTIVINIVGCALLGVIARLVATEHQTHGLLYAAVGTGFCGAFTTFSTFTWETLALFEDGLFGAAAVNVVASLVLGIGAAAVGYLAT